MRTVLRRLRFWDAATTATTTTSIMALREFLGLYAPQRGAGGGRATPRAGELFYNPALWASLGSLASEGCAWFYGEAVRVALRHVAERGAWR